MPSTRARFWSISRRITFDGSSHSNWTSRDQGLARITSATPLAEPPLHALRRIRDGGGGRPVRQPQGHEEQGVARRWKELLLHETEREYRREQECGGGAHDRPAMLDAPGHEPPEAQVEGLAID